MIHARSGCTLRFLSKSIKCSRDMVLYHIGALEAEGLVTLVPVQRECHVFPQHMQVHDLAMAKALADPRADRLWVWFAGLGPFTRGQAMRHAYQAWNVPRTSTHHHIRLLLQADLLHEVVDQHGKRGLHATRCILPVTETYLQPRPRTVAGHGPQTR